MRYPLRYFTSEFVEPSSTYITNHSSETIRTLNISSGTIASIQSQIDTERTGYPNAVILVNLSGTYTVGSLPLDLPQMTCLVLDGTIGADGSTTADCLIQIDGTYKTSVSGGLLDGAEEGVIGIKVNNSKFFHIDNVRIERCSAGIDYYGKGTDTWNAGSAISRCEISDCTTGIKVANATQTLVMDSYIYRCQDGIDYSAVHGTIYNNVLASNTRGIKSGGQHNLVHQCRLYRNSTAISSESTSDNNIYTKNRMYANELGLYLAGTDDVYYANHFKNDTNAQRVTSADTFIVPAPNDNDFSISGIGYFNPPTIDNPDVTDIVNGKTTYTLTVNGGTISNVQSQLNTAYTNHPNKVIVLKLNGTFNGDQTLTLDSYTCVVLNGTINVNHTGDGVASDGTEYVSFSGGTIDGQNNAYHGIDFDTRVKHSVLDSVEVKDCVRDVVHIEGSWQFGEPVIVTRCNVHGSPVWRALWTQVKYQVVVIDSRFADANLDGIDNDSHSKYCYNIDNICEDNGRCGIFIEIHAQYTNSIGNILRRNSIGINVFADNQPVSYNSSICNEVYDNINFGLRYQGRDTVGDPDAYSTDGFSFNNVCYGNGTGLHCMWTYALRNYFCQDVSYSNTTYDVRFDYDAVKDNNLFNPPLATFSGFSELAGDLNVNEQVDMFDFSILSAQTLEMVDLNTDGLFDVGDLSLLAENWLVDVRP